MLTNHTEMLLMIIDRLATNYYRKSSGCVSLFAHTHTGYRRRSRLCCTVKLIMENTEKKLVLKKNMTKFKKIKSS